MSNNVFRVKELLAQSKWKFAWTGLNFPEDVIAQLSEMSLVFFEELCDGLVACQGKALSKLSVQTLVFFICTCGHVGDGQGLDLGNLVLQTLVLCANAQLAVGLHLVHAVLHGHHFFVKGTLVLLHFAHASIEGS